MQENDIIYIEILGGNIMEFKEFSNPEAKDYDVKVGVKNLGTIKKNVIDNSLNTDEGIDLNMLGQPFEMPTPTTESNATFNEYGEIVRKSR